MGEVNPRARVWKAEADSKEADLRAGLSIML